MPHDFMLHPTFDASQVATSIVIAIVASYAALALSSLVGTRSGTARLPWLFGGGFAVGLGISGMHFVGMLAMRLTVPVTYDTTLTIASFAVAIVASTAALAAATTTRYRLRIVPTTLASLAFGTAVTGMHYVGMAAMRGPFAMQHDISRVLLSFMIAFGASGTAFWFAHRLRNVSGWAGFAYQLLSAIIMGAAIAGMHYVAISAVTFKIFNPGLSRLSGAIAGSALASLVTIVGMVILSGAILAVLIDQRARLAAREIAAKNEHYREMAEAMPQIVWTARADGAVDYFNRRWTEYTGKPATVTDTSSWIDVFHPEEAPDALTRWTDAVRDGAPYEMEYRLRRASDGGYRWHLGRAVPLTGTDGTIVKWFGTCTDIDEQKRAQTILRANQVTLENRIEEREAEAERATALYQLLAENATDMVSTHSPDGRFEYATPSWIDFLGDSPIGRLPTELSHPADIEDLQASQRISLRASEPVTMIWRCHRDDDSYAWLETRTRAVRQPGTQRVVTYVCATRDITQSKFDEIALRESEDKYRQLVEQAADAIMLFDIDLRCAGANARAGLLMGLDADTLVGRRMESFLIPAAVHESPAPQVSPGGVVTCEYNLRHADGSLLPVEVSAATLADGRVQISARDIRGRKELERLKDQFVSVVSHELRTPLTSIRGSLGLLASGQFANAPEKGQRMLAVAVTNTDRLIRLINDILDIERISSGAVAMEPAWCDGHDIAMLVIEAMRPMADRVGVGLGVRGGHVRLWADSDRITQTLTNLVGNAIKFSPQGALVEIAITTADSYALFEVRDRGRGIPAEKLETIFERFQQVDASDARDKGGTGLGLAISRGIVQQHGGRIWAENNIGGGSVFKFTLPLPAPLESEGEPTFHGATIDRELPVRILVIEDDIELAHVMATSLEARGFVVDVAHDGMTAIDRHATSGADILIVDLSLPDIAGIDLIDRIHAHGRPIEGRTIVYTASDPNPATRERIRALGADLATKGRVSTAELVERVVQTLELARSSPLRVA